VPERESTPIMLIFWRQRLVVLATPKTGSTSLEAALESLADVAVLRPRALRHTSAAACRAHVLPYLEAAAGARFETVALMREPVDWLGSWYRAERREAQEAGGPEDPASAAALASFPAYVAAHLGPEPPAVADVGSQAAFLGDGAGRCGVDRLFRYDQFDAFTAFLGERLDCDLVLPRLNASPAGDIGLPADLSAALRAARTTDFRLYESLA
jgi:hypothetical protein